MAEVHLPGVRYVHTDPAVVLPFADGTSLVLHRDSADQLLVAARTDGAHRDRPASLGTAG